MSLTLRSWDRLLSMAIALVLCLGGILVPESRAAEVGARAILQRERASVGDAVQLQVRIDGASDRGQPPNVAVDGLEITYLGPSTSTEMRYENGRVSHSSTTTHIFQVVPQRAGTFTIPSLKVDADGRQLQTQPVTLKVDSGGSSPDGRGGIERLAFAEITLPKTAVYVGETVPVELRLYYDQNVKVSAESMPTLNGEGFTKQKFAEPRQVEHARKDGKEYEVRTYRTAITPSRAGKLTVGTGQVEFIAQIPIQQQGQRRQRPRSLFEGFMGDDFGIDPFFPTSQRRRMKVTAEAVELEVKALPVAGKPKDFSGAVGSFKLTAEGSPDNVKVGDPVTMKVHVFGRGNFERVNAPTLVEPQGWRAYPPGSDFKPEDELGISGTKSFEMAVIPEVAKRTMPQFAFSYFDPEAEKYVTLKSEPEALQVTGAPAPRPAATPPESPAALSEQRRTAAPAAAPSQPQVNDIVGLRYDVGRVHRTFDPLYERPGFWLAQAFPAAVLLGFGVLRLRRSDAATAEMAARRREKAELWSKLRQPGGETEFLERAARFVQIDTALATGQPVGSVDASAARASRALDPATAEVIDEIFSARAELLYAGTAGGEGGRGSMDRQRVRQALATFEKSHGR